MTTYAIASILPDEIGQTLDKLRQEYRNGMEYVPEPHITLKYPFVPKYNLESISKILFRIAEGTKPFTLLLNGIGYFEEPRKVAFIIIENKKAITALHFEIINCLQNEVATQFGEIFDQERFHPHITIGDNISDPVFARLKSTFAHHEIRCEVEIKSFSLFSDESGGWKPIRNFNFS